MVNCKTVDTPVENNLNFEKGQKTCNLLCQQLIDSLTFLGVMIGPDIYSYSYSTIFLMNLIGIMLNAS